MADHCDALNINFQVLAQTRRNECVFIVGNIPSLGAWKYQRAKAMTFAKRTQDGSVWKLTVSVPIRPKVHYRYFIGIVIESEDAADEHDIVVLKWEVHRYPHTLTAFLGNIDPDRCGVDTADTFGLCEGKAKVDRGWLTCQHEIRLRLHSDPIKWYKSSQTLQNYRIKCIPIDLLGREMLPEFDEDSSAAVTPLSDQTLVSVLNGVNNVPCEQQMYGASFKTSDYLVFYSQTLEPEYQGYELQIFTDTHKFVGHAILLPVTVRESQGCMSVPILGLKCKPIGRIKVEWLLIKPMNRDPCDLKISYAHHWKSTRRPLDIGHRGMGSSHKSVQKECAVVLENTLASFAAAGRHGADMVEFDVHLSKDKVPIVYHDFTVCISAQKKLSDACDWVEVPVSTLNHQELQTLKVAHRSAFCHVPSKSGASPTPATGKPGCPLPAAGKGGGNTPTAVQSGTSPTQSKGGVSAAPTATSSGTSPTPAKPGAGAVPAATSSGTSPTPAKPGAGAAPAATSSGTSPTPAKPGAGAAPAATSSGTSPAPAAGTVPKAANSDNSPLPVNTISGTSPVLSATNSGSSRVPSPVLSSSDASVQPFPSLREVFEGIDPYVAFNIEIKYPMILKMTGDLEDGLTSSLDRNEYVDGVLAEIFHSAGSRRIVLSCFDPDVCSMLRVKQNKYPVMFLTQGCTNRYPKYSDPRTNSTLNALHFSVSEGLLGVVPQSEELLKDPSLIERSQEMGLVMFCWGNDNNNKNTIAQLKSNGVAGVIYDRISEFKNNNENVFREEQDVYGSRV